jgi:cobalt-zinc-cadmium efflux system membrane fusion protein
MNNIKYSISILTLFMVIVFSSCGHEHTKGDGHNHGAEETTHSEKDGHDHGSEEENHEEGIHLTKKQAETIGLEFGALSSIKVNDFVKATGSLGLPPNAHSSVSAKADGIIKSSRKFVEGNYIKKGAVIAYLENPDFIVTQQEYLEAKAQLHLKRLDAKRQKTLVESNAGVTKNLQNAQAEVAVWVAKTKGLAKQLSFLGISASRLTPNNIRQQIAIVSPMSGYISKIDFHNGMYAQSSVSLMDIISAQHLHLELDVFEKDIANIKEGQKISYTVPALGQTIYYGRVDVIGKEFNSTSKTVRVHGHLDGIKPNFLKDLFLNAKIFLTNVETTALPEKAIIKDGESNFIYVARREKEANEIQFEKINVLPGSTDNGYTAVELIDTIPDGKQIVTKGAYYVYAQSKAGELEHEH